MKLHRSGRHPEDIYWSSNPKYVNKAKIAGRQSSGDDSTIYKKMLAEKECCCKAPGRALETPCAHAPWHLGHRY